MMQANSDIHDGKMIHFISTTAVGSLTPAPIDPAIQALTEQMAALTLLVKSSLFGGKLATSTPSPNLAALTPIAITVPAHIPRYI